MTVIHKGAAGTRTLDLHNPDGSHVGTARTAGGRDLEQHERRIKAHLQDHKDLEAERRAAGVCPFVNWGVGCILTPDHDGDHEHEPDAFPLIP